MAEIICKMYKNWWGVSISKRFLANTWNKQPHRKMDKTLEQAFHRFENTNGQ